MIMDFQAKVALSGLVFFALDGSQTAHSSHVANAVFVTHKRLFELYSSTVIEMASC